MDNLNMYDRLLGLPLFQGMSKNDLSQVVGHTKFEFGNALPQEVIVREGSRTTGLIFITSGTVSAECYSADHSYSLREVLQSPLILNPECLFGLLQHYPRSYIAETSLKMIYLSKEEVLKLSDSYEIFRINLLNIITTQSQKLVRQLWQPKPSSVKDKIAKFIVERCLRPSGEKELVIKMTTLAQHISESRLTVSKTLKEMSDAGLLTYSRGKIHIPAMELLLR